VEAPKQNDAGSEVVSDEQAKEEVAPAPVIDLSKFDPKRIALFEAEGLPITDLANWINQTDVTLKVLVANMPNQEQIENAMGVAIERARQREIAEYKKAVAEGKTPQGGGGGKIGMMEMIQMFGGGGGDDSEFAALGKELVRAQIAKTKTEDSILMTLGKEVFSKVLTKGVKKVVDAHT